MNNDVAMQKIQTGALFREWMQHPAFKIWHRDLEAQINDVRKNWLTCEDPVKAEKIRTRAVHLNEALDIMKKYIVTGDLAAQSLKEEDELQNSDPA